MAHLLPEVGRLRGLPARIKSEPASVKNLGFAEDQRFILAEERTFLRKVV